MLVSSPPVLNAHLMGTGFKSATLGIDLAQENQLSTGATLFRFIYADFGRHATTGADGPWWVDAESFKRLRYTALSHGLLLSVVAGRLAGVRIEWNEVNGYVQAEVIAPLKCWKGKGRHVAKNTRKRAHPRSAYVPVLQYVYQLYIPGIGGLGSLFSDSFRYLDFTSIQSAQP